MADINSRLKRALDGPGPQHKVAGQEAFEFSEGSDGSLHVKDAGVTAELAAIKDTQAEIISALAATNAKLDGTINTQVTGSNVEQRGLSANKPLPSSVPIGSTYWSVDADPHGDAVEVSDGTNWTVV